MQCYEKRFAEILAESGALFFDENLVLKDGRSTPYFVNMGVFNSGDLAGRLGECFADLMIDEYMLRYKPVLIGPSYKGSMLVSAVALALFSKYKTNLRFDYDRKEAKEHGDAKGAKKMFVTGALIDGDEIIIIDDVGSSMRTKYELLDKIHEEAKKKGHKYSLENMCIGIDRQQTLPIYDADLEEAGIPDYQRIVLGARGEDAVQEFMDSTGIKVNSIAGITDVITHLYRNKIPVLINGKKQPMPKRAWDEFIDYFMMYGVLRNKRDSPVIEDNRSIILSCDFDSWDSLIQVVKEVDHTHYIGGYKIGFELAFKYGLYDTVRGIRKHTKKPIIYDHQKAGADVPFTGEKFAKHMVGAGVDAAILFPRENDDETLFAWIEALKRHDVEVMVGAELTSRKPTRETEQIYWTAAMHGVRHFVVPGNKLERIEFYKNKLEGLGIDFTLYSPGLGVQGGNVFEASKIAGNKWHGIVGRSIYDAENPMEVVAKLADELEGRVK